MERHNIASRQYTIKFPDKSEKSSIIRSNKARISHLLPLPHATRTYSNKMIYNSVKLICYGWKSLRYISSLHRRHLAKWKMITECLRLDGSVNPSVVSPYLERCTNSRLARVQKKPNKCTTFISLQPFRIIAGLSSMQFYAKQTIHTDVLKN